MNFTVSVTKASLTKYNETLPSLNVIVQRGLMDLPIHKTQPTLIRKMLSQYI